MTALAPAPPSVVPCPACQFALPPDAFAGGIEMACPQCRTVLSGTLFSVFWNPDPRVPDIAELAAEGEAVCFFHPENRAALSCERCGRFICSVCDMPLGARHLCPACLSSGLGSEKLPELVVRRFLWSDTALLIGLVPLLLSLFLWPGLIVSGPAAIFCALFGWKRLGSLPRGRGHWAAVLGLAGGVVQLAIWGGFLFLISNSRWFQMQFR